MSAIPIRIKRSTGSAAPATLGIGELAYTEGNGTLYIGKTNGAVIEVGGNADHVKLAGIEAGAEVNTVTSVAGRTGAVVVDTDDLASFNTDVDARIGLAVLEDLANISMPSTPADGAQLTWDNTNEVWVAGTPGTGATTFVQLSDVPNAYTGAAGYLVQVNAAGTGLEFVSEIDGGTY
jgi:hypothetical protein